MKTRRLKLIYVAIAAISILVIGFSLNYIYGNLGGYEPIETYKLDPIKRTVVGKHFKTRYTDKVLEEQYLKCRELVANKKINGELTVITYFDEALEENHIKQFIGVTLQEDVAEIPVDFEIRDFESKSRYAIFLSMHPLVRPTAAKTEALLHAKAQEEGFELESFIFELHYQDNSVALEGWVK